jgi:hypothetical protein
MSDQASPPSPSSILSPEDEACRLVGSFLQNFALMEHAIDDGIRKLLKLEMGTADIICSIIPFAKKIDVLLSAENLLAELPDNARKTLLRETRSGVMSLNQNRIMYAHNSFSSSSSGGVEFRRVVANGKLSISIITHTLDDVEKLCAETISIRRKIDQIVSTMKPYEPSLDFSDPRNSMYIPLLVF